MSVHEHPPARKFNVGSLAFELCQLAIISSLRDPLLLSNIELGGAGSTVNVQINEQTFNASLFV